MCHLLFPCFIGENKDKNINEIYGENPLSRREHCPSYVPRSLSLHVAQCIVTILYSAFMG